MLLCGNLGYITKLWTILGVCIKERAACPNTVFFYKDITLKSGKLFARIPGFSGSLGN